MMENEFIQLSKKIYKNEFDYGFVSYKNLTTKVTLVHNPCGTVFSVTPRKHLDPSKVSCPNCGKGSKYNQALFIKRAKEVHGENAYNYNLIKWEKTTTKVLIQCNECGKFFYQFPNNHLSGHGCSCGQPLSKISKKIFFEKAKKLHKDKLNFENSIFLGLTTPIQVECLKHGEFSILALDLLNKSPEINGCPKCRDEIKMKKLYSFLNDYNLAYTSVSLITGYAICLLKFNLVISFKKEFDEEFKNEMLKKGFNILFQKQIPTVEEFRNFIIKRLIE